MADAGLLARLRAEAAAADTAERRRLCIEHIFRNFFAALITEREADALRAVLPSVEVQA